MRNLYRGLCLLCFGCWVTLAQSLPQYPSFTLLEESSLETIDVRISNVRSKKAFVKLREELPLTDGIVHVMVNSVTVDSVLYTLTVNIPSSQLIKKLDQIYRRLPKHANEDIINYRLKT